MTEVLCETTDACTFRQASRNLNPVPMTPVSYYKHVCDLWIILLNVYIFFLVCIGYGLWKRNHNRAKTDELRREVEQRAAALRKEFNQLDMTDTDIQRGEVLVNDITGAESADENETKSNQKRNGKIEKEKKNMGKNAGNKDKRKKKNIEAAQEVTLTEEKGNYTSRKKSKGNDHDDEQNQNGCTTKDYHLSSELGKKKAADHRQGLCFFDCIRVTRGLKTVTEALDDVMRYEYVKSFDIFLCFDRT